MREYELLYVLLPTTEDEAAEALQQRFAQTITSSGGEVLSVNPWGKRRLAYEVAHVKEGIYVQVRFNAGTEAPAELDRVLKYAEPVIRHIIVRADDLDPELTNTVPDQIPEPGSEEWSIRGRGRYRDAERAPQEQPPAEAQPAPEGEAAAESGEAPAEAAEASPEEPSASEAPEEEGIAGTGVEPGDPADDTPVVLESPSQAEGADDESAEPQGEQDQEQEQDEG